MNDNKISAVCKFLSTNLKGWPETIKPDISLLWKIVSKSLTFLTKYLCSAAESSQYFGSDCFWRLNYCSNLFCVSSNSTCLCLYSLKCPLDVNFCRPSAITQLTFHSKQNHHQPPYLSRSIQLQRGEKVLMNPKCLSFTFQFPVPGEESLNLNKIQ